MTVGKFSRHSAQADLIWQLHKSLFWSFQSDVRTACQIMQLFREVISMINFRDYFLDAVKEVSHYFGCHVFWWFIFACLTEWLQLPNCSEASGMPTSCPQDTSWLALQAFGLASYKLRGGCWTSHLEWHQASLLQTSADMHLKFLGVQHPD
jgi:hypothetical protein